MSGKRNPGKLRRELLPGRFCDFEKEMEPFEF